MTSSFYLAAACMFMASIANAQFIRVPAGKKFEVVTVTSTEISSNIMGQPMQTNNKGAVTQEYAVQNVTASGYTVSYSLKRIVTDIIGMGQERHFDTNDSTNNLPGEEVLLKELNKIHEVKFENGIITTSGEGNKAIMAITGFNNANANAYGIENFFLSLPPAQIKQGYSWADSSVIENMHISNQYIIISTANQQVEVRVTSDARLNAIIKQSGVEITANLKTFSNTTRKYDAATGLLMSETTTSESTGTNSIAGTNVPIIMKATVTTTVQ